MEGLQTITQITRTFGISTRTMRYYEQLGLIESKRVDGYSYRVYDQTAFNRLQQIILLRKLRIPLKQIQELLMDPAAIRVIDIFTQNLNALGDEIQSLSVIHGILKQLIEELRENTDIHLKDKLLSNEQLLSAAAPLSQLKISVKEERVVSKLESASNHLGRLTDRDVRIIYLPPATVAAYQYVGDDPEMHVDAVVKDFVQRSELLRLKPDVRHYGFNAPNPVDATNDHGYESWVTIPDDLEVPAPLVKKNFPGGMYAAHMIPFGAFEEWGWLAKWVAENDQYTYAGKGNYENMFDWLEEHLNYFSHALLENSEPEGTQLDLLIPIKFKSPQA